MHLGDCNFQRPIFRLTISCFVPEIFAIKLWSCLKSSPNFDVLGLPMFSEGPPKFRPNFINCGQHWRCVKICWWLTERPQRLGAKSQWQQQMRMAWVQHSWHAAITNSHSIAVKVALYIKSNNQTDLDLDRFVKRDQSDQTKKNAFDTAVKR